MRTDVTIRVGVTLVLAAYLLGAGLAQAQPGPSEKSLDEILDGLGSSSRGMGSKSKSTGGAGRIAIPIQFETGSATISPASREQLATVAEALRRPELRGDRIRIEGHTDNVGGNAYNQALSERRADAVRRYLIDRFGIAAVQLEAVGYGEDRPVRDVDPDSAAGRALNRRVELVNLGASAAAAEPSSGEAEAPPGVRVLVTHMADGKEEVLPAGGVLLSDASYRISITPERESYVYVYQLDNTGKMQALFPNADIGAGRNPLRGGRTVQVPSDGTWLTLDQIRGREQLIAIAAAHELDDPKAMAFEAAAAARDGGDAAARGVNAVPAAGVHGDPLRDVFTYRFVFVHK